MKSPYAGMDPYLETKWPEVHARLIVYTGNQLNALLPNDLQANIEENLEVRYDDLGSVRIRPDLHVSELTDDFAPSSQVTSEIIAISQPSLKLKRPPHPDRHIEIKSKDGTVITAIEFVSPWNKVGSRNRESYTRKQMNYIDAGVNLVEVDLVRQGGYVLAAPLEDIPIDKRKSYMICVYRDIERSAFDVYFASMHEPLPNIGIPLRPEDQVVPLQLQALIDQCYHDGRYWRLDYSQVLSPPLEPDELPSEKQG